MKKCIVVLFVSFFCLCSINGQELDSILKAIKLQKDTTLVNSLISLGKRLRSIDKDSAIATFENAVHSAKKINFYKGQTEALRFRGITYGMYDDYVLAITDFNAALELGLKHNNIKETANAYNGLGIVYKKIGDYVSSLKNYNNALKIYQKNGLKVGESAAYSNLGVLYDLMGDYENSYKYYLSSYKIEDSLRSEQNKNSVLANIAVYHIRKKEYNKAISILKRNSTYYGKSKSYDNLITTYNNVAHVYKLMKVYDSTIHYTTKVIEIIHAESLNKYRAVDAYLNRSSAFLKKGNFKQALNDANNNFELAEDLGLSTKMESYQLRAEINDSIGNYKESAMANKMVIALKDSLFEENKVQKYKSEQVKQQVYLKNEQIANQENNIQILNKDVKQKRIWNLFLLIIIGLFTVSMILLYQRFSYRNKMNLVLKSQNDLISQQKKEIEIINEELENRMLRAQINPHFIFNALNSIQHFITVNDTKSTLKYLTKFSSLLRQILENSISAKVSIDNEIKFLKIYIDLEALRFDHSFSYEIKIDDEIDTFNTEVPILFLQPFVENAILHGLLPKEGEKHLLISVKQENNFLVFEIEDNGIGRTSAKILKEKKRLDYKSRGLSVTEQRIKMLQKEENQGSVSFIDLKDGIDGKPSGTKVVISVPIDH